jgi:opacity protein-like surface antigen
VRRACSLPGGHIITKKYLFAGALVCAIPGAAQAQIVLEANGAYVTDEWGGELGAGYKIDLLPGFDLTLGGGGFFHEGDNERYFLDDNGGNERCRDSANGQYAESSRCNNTDIDLYGRAEATYTIPFSASIGAGVRVGRDVTPYGTASFPLLPSLRVKGNAGPDYYAIGLRASF